MRLYHTRSLNLLKTGCTVFKNCILPLVRNIHDFELGTLPACNFPTPRRNLAFRPVTLGSREKLPGVRARCILPRVPSGVQHGFLPIR